MRLVVQIICCTVLLGSVAACNTPTPYDPYSKSNVARRTETPPPSTVIVAPPAPPPGTVVVPAY
jgi:hypothetical protein